jgi:transposase InsO family protein
VTDTLELALQASGCDQIHVVHKPRLLSDNGSSYVSGDLAEWLQDKGALLHKWADGIHCMDPA